MVQSLKFTVQYLGVGKQTWSCFDWGDLRTTLITKVFIKLILFKSCEIDCCVSQPKPPELKMLIEIKIWTVKCEGRTGVFLWCVISWFYFPWNVNLGNYSSWLVTWGFDMTHEEPEFSTDICDFTTIILRDFETEVLWMVRVVCWRCLRYVICNMEPWRSHLQFCFLQTPFQV